MNTESTPAAAAEPEATGRAATLVAFGIVAYVVVGVFWMDAHGTGPTSTLTLGSIVEFLRAIFLWPLDLVGVL